MKDLRLWFALLFLPVAALAAERTLKIDRDRSFVDVDVSVTIGSFRGHLDAYDAKVDVDDAGKIKDGTFGFKFSDLKTGNPDRDAKMIAWLGGGAPEGHFEVGALAMTPDGQGHVSGRLTFHQVTHLVEFPINVTRDGDAYLITGETTIDYRSWDLKIIRVGFKLGKVDPEVKIRFKLTGTPMAEAKG